ncbi:MAG: hypothetical protein KME31_23425 [Tolypothrix carrinoi HA7290-LM1]|nr:hypothetical protein [Tolypothrix carrinoi HA7290-LM1]
MLKKIVFYSFTTEWFYFGDVYYLLPIPQFPITYYPFPIAQLPKNE